MYNVVMSAFLTIALIHMLAVMSPGPDFVLCTRNSLTYSRTAGIFTALGFALGILVHVGYCLLGIGLVISKSILLFNVIKYLGAAYLMFIGWKALTHKTQSDVKEHIHHATKGLSAFAAIKMGFLCNVLNPKVTVFFLALFTQVIAPSTPLIIQIFYGLTMSLQTFLWFSLVSSLLSLQKVKTMFSSIQSGLERTMGAILIALGLRVALASRQ
jgi:RhtB (resistance to homoserine/threonine) family protein